MGLRMAGTAVAAALTLAAIIVFSSPRPAVGAPGSKAPLLVVTERRGSVQPNTGPGFEGSADAACFPGESVVGGGFHWGTYIATVDDFGLNRDTQSGQQQDAEVVRSSQWDAQTWRVSVLNTSPNANIDLRATVMCAKIQ